MKYKQQYETEWHDGVNWKTLRENSQKNFEHLRKIDEEQKNKGEILYRFFFVNVADGKVPYQIVKVGKRVIHVERCPGICLDEYVSPLLGDFCSIKRETAESYIKSKDALNEIFSKKSAS